MSGAPARAGGGAKDASAGVASGRGASALSPAAIFRGRGVFVLGGTGFVGKVLVSMLLHRFPDVRRVYVMVRRGTGTSSEARFWNNMIPSPTFDPLREKHGGDDGLAAFLREKVVVIDGDIVEPNLGMTEEAAARVAADIDVVINSSGRVTFNPPLESALRTNVQGTKNVIAFVKRMKRPALVHTSTCFVAGNRSGEVWENEQLDGYFPRRAELPGVTFSVEQEMADSDRIAAEVRAQADDAQVTAKLRQQARARLLEQSRDPDDEGALRLAVARERKDWIRNELTQRGMKRAAEWGWPNIYTYTKSMGDQLVGRETGIARSIVRPAIVESAISYPFPGWNEGFTTSAPLVYLALKGQNMLPVGDKLILDMVPVDHVVAGMLLVAAQACVEEPALVHQLASGDLNPSYIDRVTTLTGLYKRKRFQNKEAGNRFLNQLAARMEFRPVAWDEYERRSIPMVRRVAKRVQSGLDRVRPRWGGGAFAETIDRARHSIDEVVRLTDEAHTNIDLFRPFIEQNKHIFRADNIRAVRDRMPAEDRQRLHWSPETIDWYDYFLNVHFPGLQKWVLPELDETYAKKPKTVYTYRDLLELFDTTTKLHATRVAMRMDRGPREEVYTYDNLRELADRAGGFLLDAGVKAGDRVLLFARNAPAWGMAYFGVLKAGGVVVPVGHESTAAEVANIARAAEAVAAIVGDDLLGEHPALADALKTAGARALPMSEVFALPDAKVEAERRPRLATKLGPEQVASLIFTSGTTGTPKGVMLSHRNFTFMVSELSRVFELGVTDGLLSVLPLHHTFEFSTGFLVPLAHGAQITYVSELNGETISRVLRRGRTTAIVGVPALWELLRRRVLQRFADRSPVLEAAMKALAQVNFRLRAKTGLDLGMVLFRPVHAGFGGRVRYLISGGSALPPEVLRTFYGMGFNFYEGYGLTETAPVLTVTTPKGKPIPGSVGKPLPGVEVKIDALAGGGAGEILARGRNVMLGYWRNDAATAEVLRDGWFHTGDLGRFDAEGNLYIVGRSKDVIIDANGKNVYPDEVEDLYRGSPWIKELSVVGLPDGTAEHVACAVVPNLDRDPALSAAEVWAKIEMHVREVSAAQPFWKRVKVLERWDGDLPRTATRKVKRREVVAELLARRPREVAASADASRRDGAAWLLDAAAQVTGRPRDTLSLASRTGDLGFDSLMWSELGAALERAGVHVPEGTDFTGATTLAEVMDLVVKASAVRRAGAADSPRQDLLTRILDKEGDLPIPGPLARLGKRGLAFAQGALYRRVFGARSRGAAHVPRNVNFLVAGNHSSHLDMGAIKTALGDAGRDIASLAAADYFFSTKWRRAYFQNFTNLVPIERAGSIRASLQRAESTLRAGRSMIVFPEGTRSPTGRMADFLPSLGYLALRAGVGVLPAYVRGTYEALPKGATVPKRHDIEVVFGPFLDIDLLRAVTADRPQQEAWRLVAALTQRIVEHLRDGVGVRVDVKAVRAAWDGQRLRAILAAVDDGA